jgi:hypothetical protein
MSPYSGPAVRILPFMANGISRSVTLCPSRLLRLLAFELVSGHIEVFLEVTAAISARDYVVIMASTLDSFVICFHHIDVSLGIFNL